MAIKSSRISAKYQLRNLNENLEPRRVGKAKWDWDETRHCWTVVGQAVRIRLSLLFRVLTYPVKLLKAKEACGIQYFHRQAVPFFTALVIFNILLLFCLPTETVMLLPVIFSLLIVSTILRTKWKRMTTRIYKSIKAEQCRAQDGGNASKRTHPSFTQL